VIPVLRGSEKTRDSSSPSLLGMTEEGIYESASISEENLR
jgi:hypothetical protein